MTSDQTQQKRTCKIMQDCARILHARLAWHVHGICPLVLHDSCTILHQFLQDLAKNVQEMQVILLAATLAKSCTISYKIAMCKIVQESCKKCARKGTYTACTCQASLACKILAQSCIILQVCFCWEEIALTVMRSYGFPIHVHAYCASYFLVCMHNQCTIHRICIDCARILGNRMHSMHAHGLCMHTVAVARYTKKIEEYLRKKCKQLTSASLMLICRKIVAKASNLQEACGF